MWYPATSILSACLILGACSTPAPPPEALPTAQDSLPQEPEKALARLLPPHINAIWEVPPLDRWEDYWLEQYNDSTGDLRHRTADLDGDGTPDHAFFLCRKDSTRRDSAYALVILFGNERDTTLSVEPWAEMQGHIGMGIKLEPPGPLPHLGGEEGGGEPEGTADLKQPAVSLEYFEKATITWYWKDGSFHKVWTGD